MSNTMLRLQAQLYENCISPMTVLLLLTWAAYSPNFPNETRAFVTHDEKFAGTFVPHPILLWLSLKVHGLCW